MSGRPYPDSGATLARIADVGVLAVLRGPDPERTLAGIDALLAGGVTGIEVTYTTPDAATVIAEACRRHPNALLGAGTLLRAEQAEEAVAAGAAFLVSPAPEQSSRTRCWRPASSS